MKLFSSFLMLLLMSLPISIFGQAPISSFTFGGAGTENLTDYYRDAYGNQYITGSFEGTVDFDNSPVSTFNLTAVSGPDIFLAKYSSAGAFRFAVSFGGTFNDEGRGIAVNANGNIFLSGYFMDQVDFDPGPTVQMLNSQVNSDGFILQLDSTGSFISVKQIQGVGEVLPSGIGLDAIGNAYICGRFIGACNFDPGNTNFTLNGSSAGDPAIFLAKYASNGNLSYAREINGSGLDILNDFYVDASQNIYLTGYYQNTVDFDPSGATQTLTAVGTQDAFFAKYDASGNFVLAKSISGLNSEEGYSITADQSGNIIVAGSFSGTVDFDPGAGTNNITASTGFSVYLSKYDNSGNLIFARGFGEGRPKVLKTDQYNNIYMGGYYSGAYNFDPSASNLTDTALGGIDMFFTRYQADGTLGFAWRFGGTSGDEIADIDIDLSSGFYLCGNFAGGISLNAGSSSPAYTSNGSFDMFFAKYTLYSNIEVRQGPFILPDFFGNYYYGTIAPGSSSGFKQFDVKNTGTGIMTLTGSSKVNLYGPDATEFTLDTSQIISTIGPGQTLPFGMSFNPTSTAIKTALIQIKNSGSSAANYLFHVNGNSEPDIDIKDASQVSIPSNSTFNFGNQNIGSNTTLQFYVANTGNDTLNILSNPKVRITGVHAADFTVTSQPLGTQVLPAGSFPFYIKFAPLDTGLRTAQMVIESNDIDEYTYVVNLNGTGAAGVLKVFLNGNEIQKTSTIALDTMNAMSSRSYIFTLKNAGNTTLNLTGNPLISLLNAYNDFNLNTSGISTAIAPGDSTHFTLNCAPDSAGNYHKTISIQNNGPGLTYSFSFTLFARDTIIPRLSYATSNTADGTYSTGNEIYIRVVFSEPVIVTGLPSLKLNSGGIAYLLQQFPSLKDFDFKYIVGSSDATPDLGVLDTISLLLNNGTITDTSGNPLYPYVPAPSFLNDNVVIDHALPTAILTSNASLPDQYNNFEVYINFTEPMFGFTQSDISLTNGRIENFTTVVAGQSYTLEISPIDTGNVHIYLQRGVALSATGVQNTPSNRLIIHTLIDLQRRVWSGGWVDRLHFSQALTNARTPYKLKTIVDPFNNYFMAGSLYANGDFDPTAATDTINTQLKRSIILTKYNEDGLLLWTKLLKSNTNNILRDAVCDQSGNLYIAGTLYDTLDLDPGPGISELYVGGYADGFISKYDPNGNYLWSFKIGNTADIYGTGIFPCFDNITSIAINQNNELLVAGAFRGTVDFDPGSGVVSATSVNAGNAFFAKYSSGGALIFTKPFDLLQGVITGNIDKQIAITTDLNNNIYLAGKFTNTVDLDPGPLTQNFNSPGIYSLFFAKYNNNGDYLFAKQLPGISSLSNSQNTIADLAVDQQQRIFLCANIGSYIDFDPGTSTTQLGIQSQFNTNIAVAGYDSAGNFRFAKQCGYTGNNTSVGDHRVNEMELDSASNIYMVGTYDMGGANFFGKTLLTWGSSGGWTGYDSFFTITDSSGNELMVKGYLVHGLYDYLVNVALDQNFKPIIAGVIDSYIDVNLTGTNSQIMNAPNWSSILKCKYNALDNHFRLSQGLYPIQNGGTYSFGNINPGSSSGYKTFTITNTGDLKLYLNGTPKISISGPHASEFTISQGATAASIDGGASTTFQINYLPTAAGIRTATITILTNDSDFPSFQFIVTGGGLPEIDIQESAISIASGSSINFPATNQLTTQTKTFTILNTGQLPLLLSGANIITITGTNSNDFSVDTSATTRSVLPGNSTTLDVNFIPTSSGVKSAVLTLANNDADEGTYLINLAGTGIDTHTPQVLSVSSPTVNGYYNQPDSIDISVEFDEVVNLSGSASLSLNSGGTANYFTGSGTRTLYFRYHVASNQNASDLNYSAITALHLISGTCADASGNNAVLTLPTLSSGLSLGGSKNIVVDTYSPTPSLSVVSGPYAPAIAYASQVLFNEPVLGFQENDIQLTNGSISGFLADPQLDQYSFQLTPLAQGTLQFGVPAGIALDSAGNLNTIYNTSLNITSAIETITENTDHLFVYPNPTAGILYFTNVNGADIRLYDVMGREVRSIAISLYDEQSGLIDLNNLPSGIYILRAGNSISRIIKN